jgi:hypothetical protein
MTAWALGDWRSGMECAAPQQTRELGPLLRTMTHMANMLKRQTALQATKSAGMTT